MNWRTQLSAALACGAILASASGAGAQSFQGGLRGAVKDAQGVIPGVTVTLTSEQTGVSRDTVTNNVGEYSFPAVDPNTYTVKTEVQGYKGFERKGVRVGTQQFITLDVVLEVGAIEETITVTGEAPLIETSNASHGEVLDSELLNSLPTVGRNAFLLSVVVPTVVSSGDTHWNRMQDQTGASALSLGGGGVRANNYLLDGFPITDLQNRSSTNPSPEMLEDVRVQVHTYDAEMGRTGGGVFNATARAGTNAFHGTGFAQLRESGMIGPNFFLKIQNIPNSPQYWRSTGGGFGGPIFRNRTFFWVAAEAYRDGLTQNGNLHVPTTAERRGDFSRFTNASGQLIPIYDPLTADAAGNRQAFPGNIIPANRINPVGANIVKALPMPNLNPDVDTNTVNYQAQDVLKDAAQQGSLKIDHHFTPEISLSGVFLAQNSHEPQNNYFPDARYAAPSYQLDRGIKVFVLNNTYILNQSTVATLRYGMNIFNDNNNLPFEFDTHDLGWNRAFADSIAVQKFPSFTFSGTGSYAGTGFTGKADRRYYSHGLNGSLTKLAGGHSFKAGADYRILGIDAIAYGASAGSYTFNGQFTRANATATGSTGNSIADLLLGYPSSGSLTLNSRFNQYVNYYGVFVSDDWRVNSRFTLNYGVRLEHETGLRETDDQLLVGFDREAISPLNVMIPAGIDPLNPTVARQVRGGLVYAGQNGAPRETGDPPAVKASPRVGVVFMATDRTVLRGGYGLFWGPWNTGVKSTNGYAATTTLTQTTLRPTTSIDNPFPGGLLEPSGNTRGLASGVSSSVDFVDPNRTGPRVQQWSADLQRELPGNASVSVGYIGSHGDNLSFGSSININQLPREYMALGNQLVQQVPNPFFGNPLAGSLANLATVQRNWLLVPFPQYGLNSVNLTDSTGATSDYHAMVLQTRKRLTSWWGGNLSYTYSRLKDNQIGQGNYYTSAPGILDNYNYIEGSPYYDPEVDYGVSLLDQPHKIVAAPQVRLPFGQDRTFLNKGGLLDILVGGWSVSSVIQFQSGFPMGVTQTNGNTALNGMAQRPNLTGTDVLVPGDITGRLRADFRDNRYFNPAAFSLAPAYTFGNAARLLPGVRSPWRNTMDLAVNKDFRTGGSSRATVRIEVINVTDTPWYAALQSSQFGNSSFGQVTTQGNYSRFVQASARFSW